jgi:hypothetical protein
VVVGMTWRRRYGDGGPLHFGEIPQLHRARGDGALSGRQDSNPGLDAGA